MSDKVNQITITEALVDLKQQIKNEYGSGSVKLFEVSSDQNWDEFTSVISGSNKTDLTIKDDDSDEDKEKKTFKQAIKILFSNLAIFNSADKNNDNKISSDELKSFMASIAGNDGDNESITLDDMAIYLKNENIKLDDNDTTDDSGNTDNDTADDSGNTDNNKLFTSLTDSLNSLISYNNDSDKLSAATAPDYSFSTTEVNGVSVPTYLNNNEAVTLKDVKQYATSTPFTNVTNTDGLNYNEKALLKELKNIESQKTAKYSELQEAESNAKSENATLTETITQRNIAITLQGVAQQNYDNESANNKSLACEVTVAQAQLTAWQTSMPVQASYTKQETITNTDGSTTTQTVNDEDAYNTALVAWQTENDRLQGELDKKNNEKEDSDARFENYKSKLDEANENLITLNDAVSEIEADKDSAVGKYQQLSNEYGDLCDKYSLKRQELYSAINNRQKTLSDTK